ncbi:MAG: 5'/3'-nucleotidase SurE [Ilumatobacteraceae bacterium]
MDRPPQLARALVPLGDVVIGAPDRELLRCGRQSGRSTWNPPGDGPTSHRGNRGGLGAQRAPALCALFARLGAFGDPFDLVVSGINPGANVGRSVYHSGTIGAAITGATAASPASPSPRTCRGGIEGQAWDEMVNMKWTRRRPWPTPSSKPTSPARRTTPWR